MTIKEILKSAQKELNEGGVSEPAASAEVLLCDVLGITRTELRASLQKELSLPQERKFKKYIYRRLEHEPVWQIIGKVPFWGMDFQVDKNVLVPRPETELLVKHVLQELLISNYQLANQIEIENSKNSKINHNSKIITQKTELKVLDLGTGAGTIAIALKSELPNADVFASDISDKALNIAKKNSTNLLISREVVFKQGSLFEPWEGQKFDIVCANLPYIPHEDMQSLAFDVLHHEPRLALDGGHGGLEIYKKFLTELPKHTKASAIVFCEIGINQGKEFEKLVKKYLPQSKVKILGDLAGIDRVAIIWM